MRSTRRPRCALTMLALCAAAPTALADAVVPGFVVETYAHVTDPMMFSFSPSGELYTGRDAWGSGGGAADPARVARIGAGGNPVSDLSPLIPDPDAVLYDATGAFTGVAGSILVGGSVPGSRGALYAIRPNGTFQTLVNNSTAFRNPNDFAVDSFGRAVFADHHGRDVKAFNGMTVTRLFGLSAEGFGIAVDPSNGDIYATSIDGVMSVHSATGVLIDPEFAIGLGEWPTLAIEPAHSIFRTVGGGGIHRSLDTVVYSIANGQLLRLTDDAPPEVLGWGFDNVYDLAFGGDGALYISDFYGDRVLRIVTPEPTTFLGGLLSLALLRRRR